MLYLVEPIDKFAYFRTEKWSIDWAIHVKCARNSHKSGIVSLYARLDVLLRVIDILQRPSAPTTASDDNIDSPSNINQKTQSPEKAATPDSAPDPGVVWIFDVVSSLNLFVSFDKFLACTWPSEHNLEGIVVTQDSLMLQMKQHRENDQDSFKEKYKNVANHYLSKYFKEICIELSYWGAVM